MKKLELFVSKLYLEKLTSLLNEFEIEKIAILDVIASKKSNEGDLDFFGLVPAQERVYVSLILHESLVSKLIDKLKLINDDLDCNAFLSDIDILI
jgi:hypothetical protein